MKDHHVPQEHLSAFARRLAEEERSAGTVEKYLRDAGAFLEWLAGAPVNREAVTGWKAHLVRSGYRPATINSMLAALNTFLRFIGLEDCRVRALRVQRRLFQSEERELSRQEYQRLLDTARTLGKGRQMFLGHMVIFQTKTPLFFQCGTILPETGGVYPKPRGRKGGRLFNLQPNLRHRTPLFIYKV